MEADNTYITELGQSLAKALYHSTESISLEGVKATGTPEQIFKQHYQHPYSVNITSAFMNSLVQEATNDIGKNYGYMSGFPYEPEMKKMAQGLVLLRETDLITTLDKFEKVLTTVFEDYAEPGNKLKAYEKHCLSQAILKGIPQEDKMHGEVLHVLAKWNMAPEFQADKVAERLMEAQRQVQQGSNSSYAGFGREFAAQCAKISVNELIKDNVSIKDTTENFILAIGNLKDKDFIHGLEEFKKGIIQKVPALTSFVEDKPSLSFSVLEVLTQAVGADKQTALLEFLTTKDSMEPNKAIRNKLTM